MMEYLVWYLATGVFAGFIAGLFGVGGGLVIVPILVLVFTQTGVDQNIIIHLAIGTSLATIVATSISSVIAHHRHQAVLWPVFMRMTPGILFGAWLGAQLAALFSSAVLGNIFGAFELLVAAKMLLGFNPQQSRSIPGITGLTGISIIIAALSALIGIGGGTLSVPFLAWCRVRIQQAVGTAAALGLPIAVSGMLGFTYAGWLVENLPPYSLGFVYLPAWLGISAASVMLAPAGAKLAHRLPADKLRKIFAIFLAILGILMLVK